MKYIKLYTVIIRGPSNSIVKSIPFISIVFMVYFTAEAGEILTPSTVYLLIAFTGLLRTNLFYLFSMAIPKTSEMNLAVERMQVGR